MSAPPSYRPLRGLLSYARPHRWSLALVLLLTLMSSVAMLAQPLVVRNLISSMTLEQSLHDDVLLLSALLVLSTLLTMGHTWLGERTAQRVVFDVRRRLIERLVRLRIPELDRVEPGTLTTRVTSDSTVVQQAATSGLIELCNGSLRLVASLVLMGVLSLPLLGMTSAVLVATGLAMGFVVPRMRRVVLATQESVGQIGAALDRALGAARTVKANGAEAVETERAVAAASRAYDAGLTGARYQSIIAVLSTLALQASFLTVIGFGGILVATGRLDIATLVAFLLYLFNISAPIAALVSGFSALQQGLGAMERIEHVHHLPTESDVDTTGTPPPARPPAIRVDHLSFAYPGRPAALTDVTFTAEPGRMTAIVGPSGAGKTTLFSLLQRFYDPDGGRILLDDQSIASLGRAEVRRRIAYVEQDTPMLAGTLRENLLYAAPTADDAAIADVLTRTGLDQLVLRSPAGLDTPVGPRGVTLSGGERQRLAIARALLRQPQVLLLDEATAHLDARSEQALRHTVEAAVQHCTVLVIAHRLSTVVSADQLILLDQGRIRARGTHSELLTADPLYAELAATQLLLPDHGPQRRSAAASAGSPNGRSGPWVAAPGAG